MHGAIALSAGVLFVGRSAKTATVQAFDLDGRPLGPTVEFRDADVGRSSVAGVDVDADRRVWIADDAAGKLRAFTLFGRPVVELGGTPEDQLDVRGALGSPTAVRARGSDDELVLLVASGGRRRHALQLHRPHDARVRVLRSLGDPEAPFEDLCDVHWSGGPRHHRPRLGPGADVGPGAASSAGAGAGSSSAGSASSAGAAGARGPAGPAHDTIEPASDVEHVLAVERRAARLQLFRDGRFVHAIPLRGRPEAAARLADGRFVVAFGDPLADGPELGRGAGAAVSGAVVLLGPDGRHLRTIAGGDEVQHPSGLVALAGEDDTETRVWVVDREGLRVQLFTLDGRGWGAFPSVAL